MAKIRNKMKIANLFTTQWISVLILVVTLVWGNKTVAQCNLTKQFIAEFNNFTYVKHKNYPSGEINDPNDTSLISFYFQISQAALKLITVVNNENDIITFLNYYVPVDRYDFKDITLKQKSLIDSLIGTNKLINQYIHSNRYVNEAITEVNNQISGFLVTFDNRDQVYRIIPKTKKSLMSYTSEQLFWLSYFIFVPLNSYYAPEIERTALISNLRKSGCEIDIQLSNWFEAHK